MTGVEVGVGVGVTWAEEELLTVLWTGGKSLPN